MRNLLTVAFLLVTLSLTTGATTPGYDSIVRADNPSFTLNAGSQSLTSGGDVKTRRMPNGDAAFTFSGNGEHLTIPHRESLSPANTKRFTLELWVSPSTLNFRNDEGESGYVYILGKGEPGKHEYAVRMYSEHSPLEADDRNNRISFYGWRSEGGLGTGAYFQDDIKPGQWLYVVCIFDLTPRADWPLGSVEIWRDGTRRFKRGMTQHDTVMTASDAPLRIGTRNGGSFFEGSIGKVAIYPRVLRQDEITQHYRAMWGK